MFVLRRTRCNHDAALLIPTAVPMRKMYCSVPARKTLVVRRTNPGRRTSMSGVSRKKTEHYFPSTAGQVYFAKIYLVIILFRVIFTHVDLWTSEYNWWWDRKATRPPRIYCILSFDTVRGQYTHVLGLFHVMRDEKDHARVEIPREESTEATR